MIEPESGMGSSIICRYIAQDGLMYYTPVMSIGLATDVLDQRGSLNPLYLKQE